MKCICCKGPFHPATGDYDRVRDVATCGPCHRKFLHWLKGMLHRRWGGMDFYAEAATSIRAGDPVFVQPWGFDPAGDSGWHADVTTGEGAAAASRAYGEFAAKTLARFDATG